MKQTKDLKPLTSSESELMNLLWNLSWLTIFIGNIVVCENSYFKSQFCKFGS